MKWKKAKGAKTAAQQPAMHLPSVTGASGFYPQSTGRQTQRPAGTARETCNVNYS